MKAGLIAGACGIGLCALARKLNLSARVADLAHSIEAVPFPGTDLYSFLVARQLRPLYSEIADEIHEADHFERILDLGTGAGYLPIEIALRDPKTHVLGLDQSADMIRVAEANARALKVGKSVEFLTGDPTNLPFPGRYVDLVVSVNTLHHWPDPLAVFEEVYHVLVPGGEFRIYDYKREVPAEKWESLQRSLPLFLRIPFMVGPMSSWRAAYSEDELLRLASQTHFEDVKLDTQTHTLFGQPMPVFNRLILRKPDQIKE